MKRLVIVEDENDLREELVDALRSADYIVHGVATKNELYRMLLEQPVDIAILDVHLGGDDGNDIAAELRAMNRTRAMGIIMLTGANTAADRIRGLQSGADVYLSKPVSIPELVAHIDSLRRRLSRPAGSGAESAWKYKAQEHLLVTPSGMEIELTHLESSFIRYLALHNGKPVKRDDIIKQALGANPDVYDVRRLEAMVSRLRKKILQRRPAGQPIKVAYSIGYMFTEPVELE